MVFYYLNCRSLTYAQRTANLLERGGVTASVRRTPKSIAGVGCGYSVKIASRHLAPAIALLDKSNLLPKNIYLDQGNGEYREVFL